MSCVRTALTFMYVTTSLTLDRHVVMHAFAMNHLTLPFFTRELRVSLDPSADEAGRSPSLTIGTGVNTGSGRVGAARRVRLLD